MFGFSNRKRCRGADTDATVESLEPRRCPVFDGDRVAVVRRSWSTGARRLRRRRPPDPASRLCVVPQRPRRRRRPR